MTVNLPKQTSHSYVQEEKIINWSEVLNKFRSSFGNDVYESWIKNIDLKKEFNHYVILSAPTRFVRDWIVSRYADKILDIIQTFKKSIQRIEFSIEQSEVKANKNDVRKSAQVSMLENSLLNYNLFNQNESFENFIVGESNELAFMAAKK